MNASNVPEHLTRAIAHHRPATFNQFIHIAGFGPTEAERCSGPVLDTCRKVASKSS